MDAAPWHRKGEKGGRRGGGINFPPLGGTHAGCEELQGIFPSSMIGVKRVCVVARRESE